MARESMAAESGEAWVGRSGRLPIVSAGRKQGDGREWAVPEDLQAPSDPLHLARLHPQKDP